MTTKMPVLQIPEQLAPLAALAGEGAAKSTRSILSKGGFAIWERDFLFSEQLPKAVLVLPKKSSLLWDPAPAGFLLTLSGSKLKVGALIQGNHNLGDRK